MYRQNLVSHTITHLRLVVSPVWSSSNANTKKRWMASSGGTLLRGKVLSTKHTYMYIGEKLVLYHRIRACVCVCQSTNRGHGCYTYVHFDNLGVFFIYCIFYFLYRQPKTHRVLYTLFKIDFFTYISVVVVVVDSEAQRDVQTMLENWDNPVFHTVQRVSITSSDMTCIPQRFKCCISQCTVEVQCIFLNCE